MTCLYCGKPIPADVHANARRRGEVAKFCRKRCKDLYGQRRRRFEARGLHGEELERALRQPPAEHGGRPKRAKTPETATDLGPTRPAEQVAPTQEPPKRAIDILTARASILAGLERASASGTRDRRDEPK